MDIPTIKEDIYTLGALILSSLTHLCPSKFIGQSTQQLRKNINIFIQNESLAGTIASCLDNDPQKRPALCDIQNDLKIYSSHLKEKADKQPSIDFGIDSKNLFFTIQAGIYGLTNPDISTSKRYWLSFKHSQDKAPGKTRDMTLYEGWHTGIAGPLWFIAIGKKLGFDVSQCEMTYTQNWRYAQNKFFNTRFSFDSSLYTGGAGIAMAIAEGMESGLLSEDILPPGTLELCFTKTPDLLTLSQGIAGQGIALLRASPLMNTSRFVDLLKTYITFLLDTQQSDGSWKLPSTAKHKDYIPFGMSEGISGIIWFLLACIHFNQDENLITAVTKALNWIIKKARKKGNVYTWPSLEKGKSINQWSMDDGIPGITLLLIKAFQVLKKDIYKEIAEANLMALPKHPVRWDFSLDSGLAGIGELYLEAYKAFGNPLWQERATWIAKIFMNSYYGENSEERHWIIENRRSPTADLYVGNTGILHFLAYYANQDKLSVPLWPFSGKP